MTTSLLSIQDYSLPSAGAVFENRVQWQPDPARAVLLIHDMQRYFINPLPDTLRTGLVHNIATIRNRCVALGVPVAYTAQPGSMTDQQRGLLRDFWGPGMRADPADREVLPEIAPLPADRVFTKWRYSAFFRSGLLDLMRETDRDQLVLCGVYAHVGILGTALEAFANDFQPFVVADAVADFSEEDHWFALTYVARVCGVVIPAEAVLP